jgi:hypothetical protein
MSAPSSTVAVAMTSPLPATPMSALPLMSVPAGVSSCSPVQLVALSWRLTRRRTSPETFSFQPTTASPFWFAASTRPVASTSPRTSSYPVHTPLTAV